MGNSCRKGAGEGYDSANIDEFYDPFVSLKSHVVTDLGLLAEHGPKNINPMR